MALGEGIVNCPVQQCKDLLLFDQKALKELRQNIEIIEVQKLSDFYSIQYKKTTGSLLFSSRDSATIRGFSDGPDGSVVITGISLENTQLKDRQIPMKKDTTRTIIELVGYQLYPIMNNQKTKIISFLHMDLKGALSGSLPQFIIKIGIKDTGQISKQINDYLIKKENQMKPKL